VADLLLPPRHAFTHAVWRWCLTLVLVTGAGAAGADAQTSSASAAQKREGEAVRLVVRPRVGDTLWLQLEQTIETRSFPVTESSVASAPGSNAPGGVRPLPARQPDYGPVREQPVSQSIVVRLFAHSLIEASNLESTTLTAISDSLQARAGLTGHLTPFRPMPLPGNERVVRIRVTMDGAMSVIDAQSNTAALGEGFASMPPMLPTREVTVGEQWERDIPLPSLSMSGVHAEGVVHAQFRLDSLSRGAKLAYVTMSGTLNRAGAARDLPPGTQIATSGTLHGSLVLDRTRGWITEAETIIQVKSDMMPRPGDNAAAKSMDIRLTQRMRVR
jgi:hypothetical protein